MTNTPDRPTPKADLDPASMAAIQELLKAETARPKASAPRAQPDPTPTAARSAEHTAFLVLEDPPADQPRQAERVAAPPGLLRRAATRASGYRPTPRHMLLAGLVLLILLRPWLVVGPLFLMLVLILGLFLALGYDGFWQRAMAVGLWYARRRPERAADLHNRFDAFAMRWDAVLDRFPEGTVDGLYLPDFGDMAAADARHDAALERRLNSLRESDAQGGA